MTKHFSHIAITLLMALIFCQCQTPQDENEDGTDYPSPETFRQIDACMGYMNSDSQRAHDILDSLCAEGLMTKARCDYFHAMVIFSGENKPDSALVICDRLLHEEKGGALRP